MTGVLAYGQILDSGPIYIRESGLRRNTTLDERTLVKYKTKWTHIEKSQHTKCFLACHFFQLFSNTLREFSFQTDTRIGRRDPKKDLVPTCVQCCRQVQSCSFVKCDPSIPNTQALRWMYRFKSRTSAWTCLQCSSIIQFYKMWSLCALQILAMGGEIQFQRACNAVNTFNHPFYNILPLYHTDTRSGG